MTRTEALRQIGDLHRDWSLRHGDTVPYNPDHVGADPTDLSIWNADRSAPPEVDDPLNRQIVAILAQITTD